jgi:hypothetical protein
MDGEQEEMTYCDSAVITNDFLVALDGTSEDPF